MKLRLLNKRHGFTLVELIVVIAIIAVLAAILTPIMFGMVTKSRVTSANSTAASISRCAEAFFTQADVDGYGVKPNTDCTIVITVSENSGDTVWKCVSLSGDFMTSSPRNIQWSSGSTYTEGQDASGETHGEVLLLASLSSQFPSVSKAFVSISMNGAKCVLSVYCPDTDSVLSDGEYPKTINGRAPESFAWSNAAGISTSGYTVGTAPAVTGLEQV